MTTANTIKIKRSGTSGAPSSLKLGELAYSYLPASGNPSTNGGDRLFIGANGTDGLGNAQDIVVIGGKYFTDLLDHQRGVLTASSALLVDADKKLDELLVDNLSLNGNTVSSSTGFLTLSASNNIIQLSASNIIAGGSFEGSQLALDANADLKQLRSGSVNLVVGSAGNATSTVTLNNDGSLTVPGTINTLSNGNLTLSPNGTGLVSIKGNWTLPSAKTTVDGYVLTANTDGTTTWAASASSLSLKAGTHTGDTGTDATIDLLTDDLEIRGDAGAITTALTKTTAGSNDHFVLEVAARLASTSQTGVASFTSDTFSVNITGEVDVKSGGISNDQLANDSFYIGTTQITLGDPSGTTSSLAVDISGTANAVANSLTVGTDLEFTSTDLTFDGATAQTINVTSTLDSVTGRGDSTTNSITVGGLTIGTAPYSYTLPNTDGSTGYALITDGAGSVSWTEISTQLDVEADTGGPRTVNLLTDTYRLSGNGAISTALSVNTGEIVNTISVATADNSTLGVASFDSTNFTVSSGAVSITNGSISNAQLTNSSLYIGTTQVTLGDTSGTTTSLSVDISGNASTADAVNHTLELGTNLYYNSSNSSFDGSSSEIIELSNDLTNIDSISGSTAGDVVIDAGSGNTWTFGTDGTLTVAGTITNVSTPLNDTDAANKAYVDATAQGLRIHEPAAVATTTALTATYDNGTSGVGATLTFVTGPTTIDNYSLLTNDRILVKDQADPIENGVYVRTSSTVWTRANDFNAPNEITGADFLFIQHGTIGGSTGWVQTDQLVTGVGVDDITFVQFSAANSYIAGDGIDITGNTISVDLETNSGLTVTTGKLQVDSNIAGEALSYASGVLDVKYDDTSITVNGSNQLSIKSTWAGQSAITTVGTITTGTWHGDTITYAYGGTGQTAYAKGDILYASASNTLSKLTAGTNGQVLQLQDGVPAWADLDGGTY
jgi:hypothetical protein